MRAVLIVVGCALGFCGCALERRPLVDGTDVPNIDVPDLDAPNVDAPPAPDVPLDVPLDGPGGLDGGGDAGDRVDTPAVPDVPPTCREGEARCDAEVLAICTGGTIVYQDCAARGAYCDGSACVTLACTPGAVSCAGPTENRCDPRGTAQTATSCTRGCTDGVGCNPPTACAVAVAGTVTPGTSMSLDTCGAGNDSLHLTGCSRTDRTGADVVLRLEIATAGDYRIDVQVTGSVDSVLYIRTACADRSTELDCNDDGAGGYSSRIDITLQPGDYFLIVDSFRDGEGPDGRCGGMNVVVSTR